MKLKVTATGIDRVFKTLLKELDPDKDRLVFNKVLRMAAEPVEAAIEAAAPRRKPSYTIKGGKVIRPGRLQARYAHKRSGVGARGRRPGVQDGTSEIQAYYQVGNLAKSTKKFTGRKRRSINPTVFVGAAVGLKHGFDGWYSYMIIHGTKYQAANNYVARGMNRAKAPATAQIVARMNKYLSRRNKRISKKLGA